MTQPVPLRAIWDTGAMTSAIHSRFRESFGLEAWESRKFWGFNGSTDTEITRLAVRFPNGIFVRNKRLAICNLPPGIDFVIGTDIIALGDFCISNSGGKTLFSFITPSLPDPVNLAEMADDLDNR
jgi:hypothetical protein